MQIIETTIETEDFRWLSGKRPERKPSSGIRVTKDHLAQTKSCHAYLTKAVEELKDEDVYSFSDGETMYDYHLWHYPTAKKTERFWYVKQWDFETKTIRLNRQEIEENGRLIHKPSRGWYTEFQLGKTVRPRIEKIQKGMAASIKGLERRLEIWTARQKENPNGWYAD
ncbi:hypothetical protein [Thalassoroseus pseudoceratinae]|uniref:hypothetical protein n=1 Tax=Thalassoroseus pseudoceratinae TaxID=2713176 RepID=UPI001421AB4C|nr:hypothetical protein [Thalassoroseus pseudoceratinae]